MGPDTEKGDILSTWKEIAAYLKIGVRTCIRWEKESGLPVHRQEGAPRSRIFAYTRELDEWFKSRLGNGTIHPEENGRRRPVWKRPSVVVPVMLVLAGAAAAAFFLLRPNGSTPPKANTDGVPQASGNFELSPVDFVETEFAGAGRLRVWRPRKNADPFETWRIEPVRHTTFAIGDLDGDPNLEIAAPGHCREYETPGDISTSKIRFFINAYKSGFKDWWMTTFYDVSQCIYEKDNYEFTETVVADVDGIPGNEILLATAHALSVFKYDAQARALRLVFTGGAFVPEARLLMRSVAVGDVDGDGRNEVLATAQEGEEGAELPGNGWLLVLRWQGNGFRTAQAERLPGTTSVRALKLGDVVPGGTTEAVVACYKIDKGVRYGYVAGWSFGRGIIFEKLIDEVGPGQYGGIFLDVGDLSPKPGEEIVIARNNPQEIISLFWDGNALVAGPKYGLDQYARVNNIKIGSPRVKGSYSSVLVNGTGDWEGQLGKFYLAVISFDDGFFPEWIRVGGAKEDLRVSYAEFVTAK